MEIKVIDKNDTDLEKIFDSSSNSFRRSFKDYKEAKKWHESLVQDSKVRLRKQQKITKLANDELPTSNQKLKESADSWKSNVCTGFYSSIVKRVKPGYKQTIKQSEYLTYSKLADTSPLGMQKTATFREKMTKFIRSWSGFNNFTDSLIEEVLHYGYASDISTDPFDWKPIFARQDEAFFPTDSGQLPDDIPGFSYKVEYKIHELADKLVNIEASQEAGWKINNLVKALNNARPDNLNDSDTDENARGIEDLVRESAYGLLDSSAVKVIKAVHIFAVEANKKVSHWLVLEDDSREACLFEKLDQFESVFDCLNTVCLEVGNMKLHGSKGLGRYLYNISMTAERMRNHSLNTAFLASLVLAQNKSKTLSTQPALMVRTPVAVFDENLELTDKKFELDSKSFSLVENFLVGIAESIIGTFLGTISGNEDPDQKASKINYVASIEQVIRSDSHGLFWEHFMRSIQKMQRKAISFDAIRDASMVREAEIKAGVRAIKMSHARDLQAIGEDLTGVPIVEDDDQEYVSTVWLVLELLRGGLEKRDILELRNAPTISIFNDNIEDHKEGIANVVAKYSVNPNIDQDELLKLDISNEIGYDLANKLIVKNQQSISAIEAQRAQLMELVSLMEGEPIPVSERDLHEVHMDVIMAKSKDIYNSLEQDRKPDVLISILKNIFEHFLAHFDALKMMDVGEEVLGKYTQWIEMTSSLLQTRPQNSAPVGANQEAPTPPPPDPQRATEVAKSDIANEQLVENPQPIVPSDSMPLSQGPIDILPKVNK